MSRSDLPPQPEVPESAVSELHALYREAAHAEPDAMLDRKILDAATAELRGAGATKARRPPPWWKGWLPAASALALALVGVSVTWRVMDQQEIDLRQEMKAAEAVRERAVAAPASVAPAQGAAETAPVPRAPAPLAEQKRRAEPAALKDAPPRVPEPAPAPAVPAPAAPMSPGIADEALKKSVRSEKEDLRERRDAGASVGAAAGAAASPARQAGKLEAGRPGAASSSEAAADSLAAPTANSAAKSAAAPAADSPSPEAWLKQIRELRAAGRSAEAVQSLARFRARYPDYAVPGDLLNLK
jgi:hypothetical protein